MYKTTFHKPVHWIPRECEEKMVSAKFHPDFHAKVKAYCDTHQMKISQLIRYAVAKEIENNN